MKKGSVSSKKVNLGKRVVKTNMSIFSLIGIITLLLLFNISFIQAEENKTEEILTTSTLQYKAVIGRPVKWIKKIESKDKNINIKLPKGAENISILTNEEVTKAVKKVKEYKTVVENTDRKTIIKGTALTGKVTFNIDRKTGILTRFMNYLSSLTITGKVVSEEIEENIIETPNETIIEIKVIQIILKTVLGYKSPNSK